MTFRVRAENTGLARWLRGDDTGTQEGSVHLVAHVFGAEGEEPLSWYHAGAYLPGDVQPGESVTVEIRMRAPAEPGRYRLEFDMVSEHLAWFEDFGSEVIRHELTVG